MTFLDSEICSSDKAKSIPPTQEEWRVLYSASVLYRDLAPWNWVEEEDLFGVRDPWTGEIGWCVIVGSLGEFPGLVVYRGDRGYKAYADAISGRKLSFERAIELDVLTASFGERKELSRQDVQVIKDLGLTFRGRKQWPCFRSQHSWRLPWYLTSHEARFLAIALLESIRVAVRIGGDEPLRVKRAGKILVRELSASPEVLEPLFAAGLPPALRKVGEGLSEPYLIPGEVGQGQTDLWVDTWVKPKTYKEPIPKIPYDLNKVRQIAAQALKGGSWDVDIFPLEATIRDETVPYYPAMLLVADEKTGFLLYTQIGKPDDRWTALTDKFLDFLLDNRQIPAEIRVERESLLEAWTPLCRNLGIEIRKVTSLPMIRFAKKEFIRSLR